MSGKKTIADRADEVGKAVTEGAQAVEDGILGAFKKVGKIKDGLKADGAELQAIPVSRSPGRGGQQRVW